MSIIVTLEIKLLKIINASLERQRIAMLFFGGDVRGGLQWRDIEKSFSKNSFGLSYILLEPFLQYWHPLKVDTIKVTQVVLGLCEHMQHSKVVKKMNYNMGILLSPSFLVVYLTFHNGEQTIYAIILMSCLREWQASNLVFIVRK